jgi:hypothetical protein
MCNQLSDYQIRIEDSPVRPSGFIHEMFLNLWSANQHYIQAGVTPICAVFF